MFFLILKRYLTSLIGYVLTALVIWILAIWFTDGPLPVLAFTAVILTLIFTVPYRMYVDYTDIKEHTLALLAISKGQGDTAPYLEKLKETVAEKTGIPSPLVGFLANRSKKFVSTVVEKTKAQPAKVK